MAGFGGVDVEINKVGGIVRGYIIPESFLLSNSLAFLDVNSL